VAFLFVFEGADVRESTYQAELIKKIENLIPGCMVLKNDPREVQGIPDLLVLFETRWAMLEVKTSAGATRQPNQTYYVETLGQMSYTSFISPDNEEEVLHELQQAFGVA